MEMAAIPIIEIVIGSGIVGMLWKMNNQLGSLTAQIKRFSDIISDHEIRLRNLEKDI